MLNKSNFKYNIKIAYQLTKDEFFLADAILVALTWFNIGINRFDVSRNNNLRTYASWWSKQGVRRYLNKNARYPRLPKNKIRLSNKIAKIYFQEFSLNGVYPSVDKITNIINEETEDKKKIVGVSLVRELLLLILFPPLSLDAKVDLGNGFIPSLADDLPDTNLVSPEDLLRERDSRNLLKNKFFSCLNKREQEVISLSFGLKIKNNKTVARLTPLSIAQIANKLGLHRYSVYKIRHKAMKKMKKRSKQLGSNLLREVL